MGTVNKVESYVLTLRNKWFYDNGSYEMPLMMNISCSLVVTL